MDNKLQGQLEWASVGKIGLDSDTQIEMAEWLLGNQNATEKEVANQLHAITGKPIVIAKQLTDDGKVFRKRIKIDRGRTNPLWTETYKVG